MKVHFLDVGQGLSILVQSDGQTMIYDGGDKSTSSFVVSYLQKQNVTTIDYLISSHYDSDHMAGLIGCLNAFDVKNVISSDYEHDSKLYQSFIQTVADKGLTMQHPAVGTEFSFPRSRSIATWALGALPVTPRRSQTVQPWVCSPSMSTVT